MGFCRRTFVCGAGHDCPPWPGTGAPLTVQVPRPVSGKGTAQAAANRKSPERPQTGCAIGRRPMIPSPHIAFFRTDLRSELRSDRAEEELTILSRRVFLPPIQPSSSISGAHRVLCAAESKVRRGGYVGPRENAARLVLIYNGIGSNYRNSIGLGRVFGDIAQTCDATGEYQHPPVGRPSGADRAIL
jgi:hypothetical protein